MLYADWAHETLRIKWINNSMKVTFTMICVSPQSDHLHLNSPGPLNQKLEKKVSTIKREKKIKLNLLKIAFHSNTILTIL